MTSPNSFSVESYEVNQHTNFNSLIGKFKCVTGQPYNRKLSNKGKEDLNINSIGVKPDFGVEQDQQYIEIKRKTKFKLIGQL